MHAKMQFSVNFLFILFQLSFLGANENVQNIEAEVQKLTNTCLMGRHHKSVPGPEDALHDQCYPWSNRSCCTVGTSVSAHSEHMYNFDWNHCSGVSTISAKCKHHFIEDLCFYECSPNVGPWLVKVEQKIRKQRFFNVPLCRSDCEAWFRDCRMDYTCTDNWGQNFVWKNERNQCPPASPCRTFEEVYRGNATYFCETIWDHSWKVVDDKEHCMRIWFNPEHGNPNDAVAKWKAEEIVRKQYKSSSERVKPSMIIVPIALLYLVHFVNSRFNV